MLVHKVLGQCLDKISLLFQHTQVCLAGEDPVADLEILDAVLQIERPKMRRRELDRLVGVLIEFHRTLLQSQAFPQQHRRLRKQEVFVRSKLVCLGTYLLLR